MTRVPVLCSCFFTSVARSLINRKEQSRNVITSMGMTLSAPITTLASKLCEVIFHEWLGPNRCEYECFADDGIS